MTPPYRYHPGILAELERFGMRPRPTTEPTTVYDLLKSLYTFEVREMKLRRRELERVLGPQPLEAYRRDLEALKEKYPALKVPPHHWVERK